jgi:anti-sigma regulatory factor (Ser/Thr protein kinase)
VAAVAVGRYFYLTPMLGGPGAPRYPVSDHPQLIGRSDAADIPLLEPTVSRQHATIECQEGVVHLKDLGSKHGTFVNSRRVSAAKLKVGDIVVFGLSLVLRLEESSKPLPPADPIKVPASTASARDSEPSFDPAVTAIRTVTVPPRAVQRARSEPKSEDGQFPSQLIKLHKLAAAGAHCLVAWPELHAGLVQLRREMHSLRKSADLSAMITSVERLLGQADQLAEALAVPQPQHERLSVDGLVQRAITIVQRDVELREVKIITDIDPDLALLGESTRLVSAIASLLQNAAKASPEGSLVQIMATRKARRVLVTISDQGGGFPQDVLDHLFDPFVTTATEWGSLGLGLFEARQIVMACGGTVQVESKRGVGATVRLSFPALD